MNLSQVLSDIKNSQSRDEISEIMEKVDTEFNSEIPSEYGIKLVAEISAWINKNERNKL